MLATILALLLVATAVVSAAPGIRPVNTAELGTTFSVTQEPSGKKPIVWRPYSDVFAKYDRALGRPVRRSTTSVDANPVPYNQEYISNIYIGSSSQKFAVQFDTGSVDLWVFSDKQPASSRGSHASYHLGGQLLVNETWRVDYVDGSGASGIVYSDKVVVGAITATSQAVQAATSVSTALAAADMPDGIFGLGRDEQSNCRPNKCWAWATAIAPQLPKNLFAVTLRKGAPGTYDFGFINQSLYVGDIAYTNVTGYLAQDGRGPFWEFPIWWYTYNGTAVYRPFVAIVDTGTSASYLPDQIINAYYTNVTGAYRSQYTWYFPCSATLPGLTFFFVGGNITIPSSCTIAYPLGNGTCYGAIQGSSGPYYILGDNFFNAYYTVFDRAALRMGFARQRGVVF